MKVFMFNTGHRLNYQMVADTFDMADTEDDADIIIHWKTFTEGRKFNDQVVCQSEPPIVGNVRYTYQHAHQWHTFVTYDPQTSNAIMFSPKATFPFRPDMDKRVIRDDDELRMRGRGCYFAGHRHNRPDLANYGGQITYQKRARWAALLVEALGGQCIGNGWPTTSKDHPDGWGARKFQELDEGDYDIHFCAENCQLKRYVSEKFWHGLLSDRLTVYMGHPHIKEQIDPSAYVFADDYKGPEELAEYLQNMTDDEYRGYIMAARRVLDGPCIEEWKAERDQCTKKIIQRVKAWTT
jgi:hypothetical protein